MATPVLSAVAAACLSAGLAVGQTAAPAAPARDFVTGAPVQALPAAADAALAGIAAPALAAHVRFLASPALEGRGLGGRGLDAAAEYAAAALALAGVPPLGPTYFQAVPLREISGLAGRVAVGRRTDGSTASRVFLSGEDCAFGDDEPQSITAPVVFAGYGIREPRLERDDYRGLDVRGAVVLVLAGVPSGERWRSPEILARYAPPDEDERWTAKVEAARALGAIAVLAVEGAGFAPREAAEARARTPFFLPRAAPGAGGATPLLRVSTAVADAVLASVGLDHVSARSAAPARVADVEVAVRVTGDERPAVSRNVVGVLAGSDPALRGTAVVIGAHLDHLGTVGGTAHPGADDDASGVAALIEIAKAFARLELRPKRTVVFAFWTGEEAGHFGSGHYVRSPLWPLPATRAYLNLDMIGHPWLPDEIRKLVADARLPDGEAFLASVNAADFVEPGLPPGAPDLDSALRSAAHATGLALHLDRTDGLHGGSDYREFARAGVPFIRFFGNFFPGYHEPGDTADALDATQVQRVARLALATAWLLAER